MLRDGDLLSAREWFTAAGRAALDGEDTEGLARAALGLGGLWVHEHRTAVEASRVAAWQRRALQQLSPTSPMAVRLANRLTAEADYTAGTSTNILAAVDTARTATDPIALAEALSLAHHCLLAPDHATLRLSLAEELLGVAALTGRPVDAMLGLLWRTVDLFLIGDPHADRSLRELVDANNRHRLGAVDFVLSAIEVMRAIRSGDFDDAEQRAAACAERGHRTGDVDALGWYTAQLFAVRWFQGRTGELMPMLRDVVNSPTLAGPDDSLYTALAVSSAAAGDRAEAISALRRVTRGGLSLLPPSSTWLVTVTGIAAASGMLGDVEVAAEAYQLLAPYADRPVMASLAVVCFGSAHYPLGVAAHTMGDDERAVEHFKSAVIYNETLGHRPALALSRGRLEELEKANYPVITCRRDGNKWRIAGYGRSVIVPDSTGMRYLGLLLDNPGREISAAELAGSARVGDTPREPVLDDAARAAYGRRAQELSQELEDAEATGDLGRASKAEQEMDWLTDQLTRLTGLGGTPRQFADAAERARTSVQKALRRAIDSVGKEDTEIAQTLKTDILTGTRCCYRPRR